MKELDLMIKKPGFPVQRIHVADVLGVYERLVDGLIEIMYPYLVSDMLPKDICFLINDEGIFKHLQSNIAHGFDKIVGNIVVACIGKDGELVSVPYEYERLIEEYMERQEDVLWDRIATTEKGLSMGIL